jgi:hypothetical protein
MRRQKGVATATAALVISLISGSLVAATQGVELISAIKSAAHHTASATKKASVKTAHAVTHVVTLGRK